MADNGFTTGQGGNLPAEAPADRCGSGWLLRTLRVGERVMLTGGITLELQDNKGRPRLAIQAPNSIRAVFIKAT